MTTESLTSIESVANALQDMGYETTTQEGNGLSVSISKNLTAVVSCSNDGETLTIGCDIANIEDMDEQKFPEFAFVALTLNSTILPYSIVLLSDDLDETEVAMMNTIPMGDDLSYGELESAMDSLLSAIATIAPINAFFKA